MNPRWAAVPAAILVMLCAGCGWQVEGQAAQDVVTGFVAAVDAEDGDAACESLADTAFEMLETSDSDCATAVLDLDLPTSHDVRDVEVWGRAAQVVTADDVVFLALVDGQWKIRAAGCEPDPPEPYDCTVDGS